MILFVPGGGVRARHTHVIRHQRARKRLARIEPAIVERNELLHGRLPSLRRFHFSNRVCRRGDLDVAEW
jgi:hypothetical protein